MNILEVLTSVKFNKFNESLLIELSDFKIRERVKSKGHPYEFCFNSPRGIYVLISVCLGKETCKRCVYNSNNIIIIFSNILT